MFEIPVCLLVEDMYLLTKRVHLRHCGGRASPDDLHEQALD